MKYQFKVNGIEYKDDKNKELLTFLRDTLDLTATKNGCNEGACGACMVIIDGKAMRACLLNFEKINGKSVTTVEGLSKREKEVFAYAFTEAGAVQCGFCIPGMVISAKVLIDKNNNPNREEVKKALIGNICRCTGYVKIEEAILLAAKIFRENLSVEKRECKGIVGERLGRVDAIDKTLGIGKYVEDVKVEGMVYGSAVRAKYPRAIVQHIEFDEVLKLDGVLGVITARDIPGERNMGHLVKDWPALVDIGEETRYVGDAIVLVVAKSKKILRQAVAMVKVHYDVLKPITSPQEALKEDAPKIHAKGNLLSRQYLKRGDADAAIKNAKYVVTNTYKVPPTEHAFLEPETAIGIPDNDGVKLYTASQNIYDEQHEIMSLLGLPEEKVRVISKYVGGGFGGKEDMSVQHHAALIAYVLKVPVKVTLSRAESLIVHPKRHAMTMEFTTACDENGILTGMKAKLVSDTGAYASLGGPVLQRACTHAAGPYNYQNVEIEGLAVYTNNVPAGAFRGFGVTQSAFAIESNLNQLSEMVGISPWEIRYRNAIKPGDVLPNGQIADEGTGLVETLLAVKEQYEKSEFAGIASVFKNSGLGVAVPDVGRCRLTVEDGKVRLRTGAACIGQGLATTMLQILCEASGLAPKDIEIDMPDTSITPNSGTTTASRQTVFAGEATRVAGSNLKEALKDKTLSDLEGEDFFGEFTVETDPIGSEKENPVSHVAYGYGTQVVILDKDGKMKKVIAAHDVGKAINPTNVEGQIEGGVVMGLGYGLTEDFPSVDGVPKVKFGTLGLFRASQVPEIETIIIEKNKNKYAFSAKGIGEIVCMPTAPALQGAYYKFDGKFRTSLPLKDTPYSRKK